MKYRVSQLMLIVFAVTAILTLAVITLDQQTQAQEGSANHLRSDPIYQQSFPVTKETLCSSVYTLTNQSSEDAAMVHEFLDGYGDPVYTYVDMIAAGMSELYDLRSMEGLPYGYNGDVIVMADRPFTYTLQLVCLTPTPTPTPTRTPTPVPTPMPETTISIYTDKDSYSAGETMYVGLDMTISGPAGSEQSALESYVLLILLRTPRGAAVVYNIPLQLPPGWSYSNPELMDWPLPTLELGIYTWIAELIPVGDAPVVGAGVWSFTESPSSGKRVVPIEKAVKKLKAVEIDFLR